MHMSQLLMSNVNSYVFNTSAQSHMHVTLNQCRYISIQAQTHMNVYSAVCNYTTTLSHLTQPNSTPSRHRIILPGALVVECEVIEVCSQRSLWPVGRDQLVSPTSRQLQSTGQAEPWLPNWSGLHELTESIIHCLKLRY